MSTAATTTARAPIPSQRNMPPVGAPGSSSGVAIDPMRLLKKYYPLLIGAAVLGAVLGAAAHFTLAKMSPRYTASATFAIYGQSDDPRSPGATISSQDELQRFMGTQMSLMVSPAILEKVVGDADVEQTTWARQFISSGSFQPRDAQQQLEKDLSVRPITSTNLMRVSMTWRNALDARRIVEAVVRAYQDDLRSRGSTESVAKREVLGTQIGLLDQQVSDLNRQRERLMSENKMTNTGAGPSPEDLKVTEVTSNLVAVTTSLASMQSRIDKYRAMLEAGGTIDYPENIRDSAKRDPIVALLDQQISSLRTDLATLKAQGYGDDHLTVISVRKRIEATEKERDEVFNKTQRKLFEVMIDDLRTGADSLIAQRNALVKDLDESSRRKEDLARIGVRLLEIDRDVQRKIAERSELEAARKNMEILGGNPIYDRVRLIVPAQTPQSMSFPKLTILVPMGVVLLVGLVSAVVLLREIMDQRVRGPADLATIARLRVLGMVPDAAEDPSKPANLATAFRDTPSGVLSESFRQLRSPVMKAMDSGGHKSLLVLAGQPGSGATTIVCNMALACANAEERVLIIDANMRRPAIHKVFGFSEGPGLGDVLAGQATLAECMKATSNPNLFILPAGTAANRNIPERLSSASMSRLLGEASGQYDRIFLDSAPAIVSGDGLALANRVHAVALVIRAMGEKRGLVNRLRGAVSETRADFLGVIVNAVRASAGGYLRGNIKATHEYQHGAQG